MRGDPRRRGAPAATILLLLAGLVTGLATGLGAGPARAEYQLSSGDVLDVNVFRVPELSRQATVDVDGRIAVPPLGLIAVRGHTLDEVSQTIESLLAARDILPDAEVTVGLAAARPVFVGGDVAAPGSFPYQPELSVRRAIALAGGLGLAGARAAVEQIPTLRGERAGLAAEAYRLQARVARLTAELAGGDSFVAASGRDGLPAGVADLETEQLRASEEERAKQRAHLERGVALESERIDTLVAQQALQQQILANQAEEMKRIREIQDRGLTNLARVQDEQRVFETMQERESDTAAQIAQARTQLEDARHEFDRFDAREKAELERQLQEASYAANAADVQMKAVDARLAMLGYTGGDEPEVTIYRFRDGAEVTVPATESTPLEPGDMLTVALPVTGAPPAADPGPEAGTGSAAP